jgi:hypothetical protein
MNSIPRAVNEIFNHKYDHITNSTVARDLVESIEYDHIQEPLINSESFSCAGKMCQIKAPIAGNSKAIAKIGNAELAHFTKQMLIHELIRGSLM